MAIPAASVALIGSRNATTPMAVSSSTIDTE